MRKKIGMVNGCNLILECNSMYEDISEVKIREAGKLLEKWIDSGIPGGLTYREKRG